MFPDGIYIISHGTEGAEGQYALAIVRAEDGGILWIREFPAAKDALDALEPHVLKAYKRADLEASLSKKRQFYTAAYNVPANGWHKFFFKKFVFEPPSENT